MRRKLLRLAVALAMTALLLAAAVPAFAGGNCNVPRGEYLNCGGGSGGQSQGGGGGGHLATDFFTFFVESGGGGGQGGGGGGRCAEGDVNGPQGCVGKGSNTPG